MGHRAGRRQHEACDDREDRRERDRRDDRQEQIAAERALPAAEELREVRRREVASLPGRLDALLPEQRPRAESR